MRTRGLLAGGLVLVSLGCHQEPREIAVGVHRLSIRVPRGWEYLDHGLERLTCLDAEFLPDGGVEDEVSGAKTGQGFIQIDTCRC